MPTQDKSNTKIRLHQHQSAAVAHAVAVYKSAPYGTHGTHGTHGKRTMIVSPTGTGKSYIALGIMNAIPGTLFVAPTQEILNDMRDKGAPADRLWTVRKLHNRMMEGRELDIPAIIFDEAHHAIDDTHQTVIALLQETTLLVGLTATPYRGTPQSSAELQLFWGDTYTALTYTHAAIHGLIRIPACHVEPLVDDDQITATGGDFSISATTSQYSLKTDDAADILLRRGWVVPSPAGPRIVAPIVVGVCGIEQAKYMAEAIERICMVPARIVNAESSRADRNATFADVVACKCVLIHINIVSEGVDLPLRFYLDLAPTLSPRLWVQRVGRQMRPVAPGTSTEYPQYVCTNRNLERHAYLLEGCIPDAYVALAQQAFPTPSGRSIRRAIGLESLGKLRADTVRLTNGLTCAFYNVEGRAGGPDGDRVAFICLLHPCKSQVVWLRRDDKRNEIVNQYGAKGFTYGKWVAVPPPENFVGYGASPAKPLTPGQKSWWDRSARQFGLDETQEVTNRRFAILPALSDIGATL